MAQLPECNSNAIADYRNGVPVRTILNRYGYCQSTFYRFLDNAGVDRHKGTSPRPDYARLAKRITLHRSLGYTWPQIRENLGLTWHKLRKVRKHYPINYNPILLVDVAKLHYRGGKELAR